MKAVDEMTHEWIYNLYGLAEELPDLLSEAGTIITLTRQEHNVDITFQLKSPAKVKDWHIGAGDGVALDNKGGCIDWSPIRLVEKPKAGATIIQIRIELHLRKRAQITQEQACKEMRRTLHEFASAMTRTWYYFDK